MEYTKRPVLVGVDGSKPALAAVRWAARESVIRSAPLKIVLSLEEITPSLGYYAVPASYFDDIRAAGHVTLQEASDVARDVDDTVDISVELLSGPARPALIDLSTSMQMVVLGSRGHGGSGLGLIGSVSSAVAAHARCAVTVVHEEPEAYEPSRYGCVLVGVDGSAHSDAALDFAFDEARLRRSDLVVAHAFYDLTPIVGVGMGIPPDDAREVQEVALTERLVTWRDRYPNLQVTEKVVAANPVPMLAKLAGEADLLVVGSRGRGGFTGLLLGSTGRALMHTVTCPLALIH